MLPPSHPPSYFLGMRSKPTVQKPGFCRLSIIFLFAGFSRKTIPNLLNDDRKGKLIENIDLKYLRGKPFIEFFPKI